MRPSRKIDRGVALLATLMAIALMTVLVVDFTSSAALGYRAAANQANGLRADYLARSGVQIGFALLAQDARRDAEAQEPYDGLDEAWATPFPPLPVEGGLASVSISDETGKLNVNRLIKDNGELDTNFSQIFTRLLQIAGISQDLFPAIIDWLDKDSVPMPGGAESDFYLRLTPPYEPRNGPMPSIGDLRMIRGVDDQTFLRLSTLLTVVPVDTTNVNTAPPEVLAALIPELTNNPRLVKEILIERQAKPFRNNDLSNLPGFSGFADRLKEQLETRSEYFTITGRGTYAGTRKLVIASVHRNGPGPLQIVNWHDD
jgi:general secretion pathway protein K